MPLKPTILIFALALGLLLPQMTPAQGTLYLSNIGQPTVGSIVVGSDAWITQSVSTGTNFGGYVLNSIQLQMNAVSGSPNGFSVSVYTHNASDSRFPGSSLGSLSGPDPAVGGTFSYNTAGILLSPSTLYFVVLTAATPVANGAYSWSLANSSSHNSSDGWFLGGYRYSSADGLLWNRSGGGELQFGVYATVVPEPATAALAGLGLTCLSFWRRKIRQAK